MSTDVSVVLAALTGDSRRKLFSHHPAIVRTASLDGRRATLPPPFFLAGSELALGEQKYSYLS